MSRQTLTTSQDYSSVTGLVLMVGGTIATVVPIQLLWEEYDHFSNKRIGGLAFLAQFFAEDNLKRLAGELGDIVPSAKYLGVATYLVNGMLIIAGSAATIHLIQKKIQEKLAERSRLVSRELDAFNVLNSEQNDNRTESRCKVCCPPTPLKTFIWGMAGLTLLASAVATGISLSKGGEWLKENIINPLPLLPDILLAGFIEIEMGILFGLGKGVHKLARYVYNDYKADKLSHLMESLDLTESELTTAGIDKEALNVAVYPSLPGRVLRFLTTTSISQALLRWPFMWRGVIGIDSSHSNQSSSESIEIQTEGEGLISLLDETSHGDDSEQALFFSEAEETNTEKQLALPSPSRVSGCRFPVFSTSGVLIRSPGIMRTVVSLNAFHDTAEMVLDGVWSALLSSLIIHNLVNYSLYPNEFKTRTTIWNILGIANTVTLLCAGKQNDRSSPLYDYCKDRTVGYEETLAAVLSEPFVWPVLLGIPLIFGFIDAVSKARNTGRLDQRRIREQISVLRQYQPGFWTDVMGWVLSAAVPDILAAFIPPAILFLLLPQPKIKRALETIRTHIIWDGQLTATQRIRLFNALLAFSQTRTQFTQMKALTMLADITDNIDFAHLKTLRQQGVDQQHLITLINIKTQALQALRLLAKHYHLPDEPAHYFRPLPRFLYANYLAWRLGRSQHFYLQPLYFAYGGVKLYFKLIFYQTLVLGIMYFREFYQNKRDCESGGGFYQLSKYYPKYFDDRAYFCICGGIISRASYLCPDNYFSLPRELNDILNFFTRIGEKPDFSFDFDLLHQQGHIIQRKQLPRLLDKLEFSIPTITIINQSLDLQDIQAIANYIRRHDVRWLHINLAGCQLPKDGLSILLKVIQEYGLDSLDLSHYPLTNLTKVRLLADVIKNRRVRVKFDATNLGDEGLKVISKSFLNPEIISMNNCNITPIGCAALANNLLEKNIYIKKLDLSNNDIDSACVIALLKVLDRSHISLELYLDGKNKLDDLGVIAITKAFRSMQTYGARIFKLSGTDVQSDNIINLILSLPFVHGSFEFHYTHYHEKRYLNYTDFLPKLVFALSQSNIAIFGWHAPSGDGLTPSESTILSNYIQREWLKKSSIRTFDFSHNNIGSGIISLVQVAIEYEFIFHSNNISTADIQQLANASNDFHASRFDVSRNPIRDAGALALLQILDRTHGALPSFAEIGMMSQGLQGLREYLYKQKNVTHPLWIDMLRFRAKEFFHIDADLSPYLYQNHFSLHANYFNKKNLEAFCNVWIMTGRPPTELGLKLTKENVSFIDNCLISSAGSNKIEHWMFWPLFRHISLLKQAANHYLRQVFEYINKPHATASQKKSSTTLATQESAHTQQEPLQLLTIDLRGVHSNEIIFIDLREGHHSVDRLIASDHNNHLLMGNENAVLDLNHNQGKNLLIPGINNTLHLSEKNKNHIIITTNLGTITIHNFTPSDHLHIIDQHTIFASTNTTICQQHHLENQLPISIISFNNTQLHFIDTPCKTILPQITYNNETAIHQAQSEVLQAPANQNNFHYFPILDIAKTFLYSFGQSALFTALPFFMAELCYQAQLFSWAQAYAFASKLQSEVLLATHLSSNPFMASILARVIVARVTGSKQLSSMAGIGASIVTGIIEHLLTENASMPWILLQISVATMGAAVGSVAIQTLPQLTAWGWCKAKKVSSDVGNCIRHGVSFWSDREASNTSHQDERFIARESVVGLG